MPLHDLSLTIDLVLRSIKERLKGNVVLHIHILLAPVHSTLPPPFVTTKDSDHPKLRPPKTKELTNQQVREMRNWRTIDGHSVPKKL